VIGIDNIVDVGHDAARFIHTNGLGERRGIRQRWHFGSQICRGLASLRGSISWLRLTTGRRRGTLLARRFRRAASKSGVTRIHWLAKSSFVSAGSAGIKGGAVPWERCLRPLAMKVRKVRG
jgi:hypothetical protein